MYSENARGRNGSCSSQEPGEARYFWFQRSSSGEEAGMPWDSNRLFGSYDAEGGKSEAVQGAVARWWEGT